MSIDFVSAAACISNVTMLFQERKCQRHNGLTTDCNNKLNDGTEDGDVTIPSSSQLAGISFVKICFLEDLLFSFGLK